LYFLFLFVQVPLPDQLLLRGILDRFLKKDLPPPTRCRALQALAELLPRADNTSAFWVVRVCQRAGKDAEPKVPSL
jgi:hypothetical protein